LIQWLLLLIGLTHIGPGIFNLFFDYTRKMQQSNAVAAAQQ
jgi:succinate dehydrogenase hydrophobic anchor subunit